MTGFLKILLLFCFFKIIIKTFKIEESKVKKTNIRFRMNRIISDVLFINGCDDKKLPHPFRYRVLHQIEQLNAGNFECYELYYLNLNPFIILDFHIIIFFRCPLTEHVEKTINFSKSLNKIVLFDIDDLVFDTKYTNIVPYVKALSTSEKLLYDEGVISMGKTLKLCQGAITTTETLAKELKNYVNKVFINHNVASEEMFELSNNALKIRNLNKNHDELIIGYFSGSITHNSDIEIVVPAMIKIFREFKNVKLFFLGEIDIPNELKDYSSKIIKGEFVNYRELPKLIANVDINIAPIQKNIFNAAKSENKWLEASLVKVPTVASNFGAFREKIHHGVTGLLCSTEEEWYKQLKILVLDEQLRKTIGNNAFEACKKEYNTIETGYRLTNYFNSFDRKHIGFFIPTLQISGGIRVVLVHSLFLQEIGYDVDLIVPESKINILEFQGHKFNVIGLNEGSIICQYDILIATLYTTLYQVLSYVKTKRKFYLVQSYETDFFTNGEIFRTIAEKTYNMPFGIEYITVSKWCETWLSEKYGIHSRFAPNGIYLSSFKEHKRNLKKKTIRILIEGDSSAYFKNVDESFKIVEKLDKNKYEIWYMSYGGKPKNWYKVDRFFNRVPYEKVNQIYEKCDILIKSSRLESFSFPPLEMMATGGYCIVALNSGNKEYLKDKINCLLYKLGDIDSAIQCIEELISNDELQQNLYKNGLSTAKKRDWRKFKDKIISLYN